MAAQARVLPFRSNVATTAIGTPFGNGPELTADVTGESLFRADHQQAAPIVSTVRTSKIVAVQNFGSDRLRMVHPLYVVLEDSDGLTVAMSYDLELAEQGATEFEALDQLRAAVVELYEDLAEMGADAPAHLRQKLSFLESLAR